MSSQTLLLCVSALALSGAAYADVTVGTPGAGDNINNTYPFAGQVGQYQQVYDASAFGGAVDIASLTFFVADDTVPNVVHSNSFTIRLSTTAKPVGGLDSDPAQNVGADDATFFQGTLGGPVDLTTGEWTITGSKTFHYDPAQGNLLLTVLADQPYDSQAGDDAAFQFAFSPAFSRLLDRYVVEDQAWESDTDAPDTGGLVTRFGTASVVAPTPEPATVAPFVLGGLALLGLARRAKKAA